MVIGSGLTIARIDYTAPGYSLTVNANTVIIDGITATYENAPDLAVNGSGLYLGGASTVRNLTGSRFVFAFDSRANLTVVGPAGNFGGMLADTEPGAMAGPVLSLTIGDGTHAASLTLTPNVPYYPEAANTYSGTTLVRANATLVSGSSVALSPSSAHVVNGTLTLATGSPVVGSLSGAGTVNLGSNTLTVNNGGTFGGSVGGAGRLRVAGGRLALNEASVSNAVQLTGGSLAREMAAGSNLAGSINVISADGPKRTGATLLSGTVTSATTVEASFAATPAFTATNDGARISDVLSLDGTGTDTFTLQLSVEGVTASSSLGWFDAGNGRWVNAVAGNTGGAARFVQGAWQAGFELGTYGVDTTNKTVWAVVNHNSGFAVVPEPGSLMSMFTALAGLALRRRRRQRTRK